MRLVCLNIIDFPELDIGGRANCVSTHLPAWSIREDPLTIPRYQRAVRSALGRYKCANCEFRFKTVHLFNNHSCHKTTRWIVERHKIRDKTEWILFYRPPFLVRVRRCRGTINDNTRVVHALRRVSNLMNKRAREWGSKV